MVIAAYRDSTLGYQNIIHNTAGRWFSTLKELARWGGEKKEVMNENGSNIFAIWCEMIKHRKRKEMVTENNQ